MASGHRVTCNYKLFEFDGSISYFPSKFPERNKNTIVLYPIQTKKKYTILYKEIWCMIMFLSKIKYFLIHDRTTGREKIETITRCDSWRWINYLIVQCSNHQVYLFLRKWYTDIIVNMLSIFFLLAQFLISLSFFFLFFPHNHINLSISFVPSIFLH